MADYEERSPEDLSDEPSPYRLEEMRQKGQVAQSKELTSTVVFIGALAVLHYSGAAFAANFTQYMKDLFQVQLSRRIEFTDWTVFTEMAHELLKLASLALLPLFLVLVVLSIASSLAQTRGFIFTADTIAADFSRVNPLSGLRRIFSAQGLLEGLKSIVKFMAVALSIYMVVKKEMYALPNMIGESSAQLMAHIGTLAIRICMSVACIMVVISAFDYFMQWWTHRNKAKVTKAEAKQEHKEREGDPQIKARIRSVQREIARKRMMKSVPKADVIITNPTHIAIAVVYEKDMMAPKVVAKGADFLAERIRNVAREHGIPIVENKVLARTLYKHVKVGQMIPRSLYQAVAEILSYVYKLKPKEIFVQQNGPGLD